MTIILSIVTGLLNRIHVVIRFYEDRPCSNLNV